MKTLSNAIPNSFPPKLMCLFNLIIKIFLINFFETYGQNQLQNNQNKFIKDGDYTPSKKDVMHFLDLQQRKSKNQTDFGGFYF